MQKVCTNITDRVCIRHLISGAGRAFIPPNRIIKSTNSLVYFQTGGRIIFEKTVLTIITSLYHLKLVGITEQVFTPENLHALEAIPKILAIVYLYHGMWLYFHFGCCCIGFENTVKISSTICYHRMKLCIPKNNLRICYGYLTHMVFTELLL